VTTKKREVVQQEKKPTRSKLLFIAISIILVIIIIVASTMAFFSQEPPETTFSLSAAIIDQLSMEYPNTPFVENVTAVLENHNFNVTYHSQKLDVEFFKKLATYNYGIIVLRVHSALRSDSSTVDLFTSESFDEDLHVQEMNEGLVVRGVLNYSSVPKEYFAISPKFLENLEGRFPESIIIAMGCWSLRQGLEQMAEAFIEKGAKAYVGWNGLVEYEHTDQETMKLITRLLAEDKTISEAVSRVLSDPAWKSKMGYYPVTARDIKISSLVNQVKSESAYSQFFSYFASILCCESKFLRAHVSKHVR